MNKKQKLEEQSNKSTIFVSNLTIPVNKKILNECFDYDDIIHINLCHYPNDISNDNEQELHSKNPKKYDLYLQIITNIAYNDFECQNLFLSEEVMNKCIKELRIDEECKKPYSQHHSSLQFINYLIHETMTEDFVVIVYPLPINIKRMFLYNMLTYYYDNYINKNNPIIDKNNKNRNIAYIHCIHLLEKMKYYIDNVTISFKNNNNNTTDDVDTKAVDNKNDDVNDDVNDNKNDNKNDDVNHFQNDRDLFVLGNKVLMEIIDYIHDRNIFHILHHEYFINIVYKFIKVNETYKYYDTFSKDFILYKFDQLCQKFIERELRGYSVLEPRSLTVWYLISKFINLTKQYKI